MDPVLASQGRDPAASGTIAPATASVETAEKAPSRYDGSIPSHGDTQTDPTLNSHIEILGISIHILELALGVFAAAFTIIAAMGILEIRRWREVRGEMETHVASLASMRDNVEQARERLVREFSEAGAELDATPTERQRELADQLGLSIRILQLLGIELSAQDYVNQAIDSFYKGHNDQALKCLDQAVALDDRLDKPWNYKSMIFVIRRQFDDALKAAETALLRNPMSASAWNNKAAALIALGRFEDGLKAVNRGLEIQSTFDEAWYNKALALHRLGNRAQALSCLREAVRLDPENREFARDDSDFSGLMQDKEFVLITNPLTALDTRQDNERAPI
jgi:tetratricopeptide (TPR) repeat protein